MGFDTSNRHCNKSMISYIKSLPCVTNYPNTGQIFFYSIIGRLRSVLSSATWSDQCIKYWEEEMSEKSEIALGQTRIDKTEE